MGTNSKLNFNWILINELAVGALPKTFEDIDFLKKEGVDCILSLCDKNEGDLPENLNKFFFCERFVLPDHSSERIPTIEEINKSLVILKNLLKKGAVYVHCYAGIERSPLLCMAYLISHKNIDRQTALEYMMQTHPKTNPLKGQLELLDDIKNVNY